MLTTLDDKTAFYDFYFYKSMIREKPNRLHKIIFFLQNIISKYQILLSIVKI